jgi:hypothetical protein
MDPNLFNGHKVIFDSDIEFEVRVSHENGKVLGCSKLSVDKGEVTIKDHENEVFRVKVYVLVLLYLPSNYALSFIGRRKSTLER